MSGSFTDQYGTALTVAGGTALPGCARIWVSERCGAHIPAGDFPALIAALYAAAGKPEPVILDRPGAKTWEAVITPGARFRVQGNAIQADPLCGPGVQSASFAPAAIRDMAAALAAMADEADGEPGLAEIQALALVLSDGTSPTDEDRVNARTVLRAGYKREPKP